jgi:ABC-2 type transport system permease protein
VIFVSAGSGAERAFNPDQPVSSGLQEAVLLYPGVLKAAEGAKTEFAPLLETGKDSGTALWNRLVQRTIFGVQLATNLAHEPDEQTYVLAARVEGKEGDKPVRAIVIADVDMMGEQFFELRRQGVENLNFDNVTFLLNAVDQLAGDESFIALRKRRPRHRTLEAVEARTRVYEDRRLKETQEAEATAQKRLDEAQARLDGAVEGLRQRADLDAQTQRIMINNLQNVENRRLQVARKNIEDEKERQIERSRADMEASIRGIQNTIKLLAVALPPIPAFVLFVLVSLRRLRREKIGVSLDRLVTEAR